MTRPIHPLKLLAAAMALVMVTGVALPAVAHACETVQQRLALAPCCAGGEDHTPPPAMPCHGDSEGVPAHEDDPPPAPGGQTAACCSSTVITATDEAARAENPAAPQVRVSALTENFWAPTEGRDHTTRLPADERPLGAHEGIGLHLLYGVLLN
jgi:hypothetical protein